MKSVFLIMSGDGSGGNELNVEAVYSSEEKAKEALAVIDIGVRPNGSTYSRGLWIEEWALDPRT